MAQQRNCSGIHGCLNATPLPGVRACVFDGTIFDFASAAARGDDVLGEATPAVDRVWLDNAGLGGLFDQVLSVKMGALHARSEGLSARLRPARLGRECDRLPVSNPWDAHTAAAFGMRVV
jgi:hypothetical protein